MALRYGERSQGLLFPASIEDYIPEDDPVRVYDAVVDAMDFKDLGIDTRTDKVGNSQYDPKAMLKLHLYGTSYGFRSSRKLERAVHHNISFIWLVGGLKPDHKTIAEFRRKNKRALASALKSVAQLCIKLKLIAGNTLFVDGTKIRANANIRNTWDEERCRKALSKIDERIEAILSECETVDEIEASEGSHVKLDKELHNQEVLRDKVSTLYQELQASSKKKLNSVDKDAAPMKSVQGSHAQYNGQAVTDEKHGLVVSCDVTSAGNDLGLLSDQIAQAEAVTGERADHAVADSGYSDIEDLLKIDAKTQVIVPSKRQANPKPVGPFDKRKFTYDKERDCYICPEGAELILRTYRKKDNSLRYRPRDASVCRACKQFGICTKSRVGREINRHEYEAEREEFEVLYEQESSQQIYKRRKACAELPFGHIKYNLQTPGFLLRGLEGVKAELSLLFSCFNIRRMISLIAMPDLLARLHELS